MWVVSPPFTFPYNFSGNVVRWLPTNHAGGEMSTRKRRPAQPRHNLSEDDSAAPSRKPQTGGWVVPCLLIFGAVVLAGFLAAERPPGGTLLAIAVIGGAVALLAKRDWQDKAFGPLGVNAPTKRYVVLGVTILFMLVTFTASDSEKDDATAAPDVASSANESEQTSLATYRERANSDDAQSIEESFFHANARALVISNIEPNKLGVGGQEFRVKRNPVGEGCFVYDPRTRFRGTLRTMVWWVPKEGVVYKLNGPSHMVTPSLKWPGEAGIDGPPTHEIVDYVFHDKPMSRPALSPKMALPKYEVIDKMKRGDCVMHGDVLVASYTPTTPVADRERTAKSIAAKEGLDDLFLYSTRDAYKAAYSDSFKKEHPAASAGYLGRWRDGKFTPNTESPASGIAKNGAGNTLRSRWLNETYNVTVRRVKGKQWEEVQNKTGRVTWQYTETGRTKDYTEIFDAKRKYEVRLFADRMELKKDGKWIWVAKGR